QPDRAVDGGTTAVGAWAASAARTAVGQGHGLLEAGMEVIVGRGHGAAAAAGAAGMVLARAAGLRHGGIARWSWVVVIDAEDAAHLLLEESRFLNDLLTRRAPDVARVLHDCGDQLEPLLHHRVH